MFANFLDFVLDGKKPALTEGTLPSGVKSVSYTHLTLPTILRV